MTTPAGLKKLCYSLTILTLLATLPPQGKAATSSSSLTSRAAARFLDQATWGSTPASVAQLQQMGTDAWLNAQFALNVSDLPNQPVLAADGSSNVNLDLENDVVFLRGTVPNLVEADRAGCGCSMLP